MVVAVEEDSGWQHPSCFQVAALEVGMMKEVVLVETEAASEVSAEEAVAAAAQVEDGRFIYEV